MAFVSVALLVLSMLVTAAIGVPIMCARRRAAASRERRAFEDRLTGVGNRHALFRSGTALLTAARHADRPAALLLMDLDGLGAVNDRHGREAGDKLLVAFARMAHDYLPPTSLVCRTGGGEFAAVLPGADAARAHAVADEIRSLFGHLAIPGARGAVRTTVSIGVVAYDGMARPAMADLVGQAGRCLSVAKAGGRNRIAMEQDIAADEDGVATAPSVVADIRLSVA